MRKLTIALIIAASPIVAASFFASVPTIAAQTVSELGDLSSLSAIATDTLGIAQSGDLVAAQKRITDFEAAWDKAAGTMQPKSPAKWRAVDIAADRAINALRAASPIDAEVQVSLNELIGQLDNPGGGGATQPVAVAASTTVFAVNNADGSPLPCEVALKTLRDNAAGRTPTDQAKYDELMNKGIERCNADDDKRADGFFAEAFGLLG